MRTHSTRRPVFALAFLLLCSCAGDNSSAEQDSSARSAPEADLATLEQMRASSGGADLEAAAAASRSSEAQQVYAATADEPSLAELEEAGEAPHRPEPEDARPGSSAPTDLDRAIDSEAPWIDMTLVGRTVRSQNRGLRSCFEDARAENPGLGRRMDLQITVGTDGRASRIRVADSSPLQHSGLGGCLIGVLERAAFPEARHGAKTFTYPISF